MVVFPVHPMTVIVPPVWGLQIQDVNFVFFETSSEVNWLNPQDNDVNCPFLVTSRLASWLPPQDRSVSFVKYSIPLRDTRFGELLILINSTAAASSIERMPSPSESKDFRQYSLKASSSITEQTSSTGLRASFWQETNTPAKKRIS